MSFPFTTQPNPLQKKTLQRMTHWGPLGLAALLAGLGSAHAGSATYGNAEITLGFPNAQITVGHEWNNGDRTVEVYDDHRDHDEDEENCDRQIVRDDVRDDDNGDELEQRVIVIRHRHHPIRRVVVVEPREPERVVYEQCEPPRVVVVPSRERRVVIVRPEEHHRVIFERSEHRGFPRRGSDRENVRVIPQNGGNHNGGNHSGNNGGGQVAPSQHSQGNNNRDLFGTPSSRPSRDRGVQQ